MRVATFNILHGRNPADDVVDVVDAKEGTVRFRKNVSEVDSMTLESRSTKTLRVKKTP